MASLADLLRDRRVAHGVPADIAEAWAEEEGRPLGGEVGEAVERVLARGPVEVADALGTLLSALVEEAQRDVADDPDSKGKGARGPKIPELVALAKAYLEIRDRALAELAIKPG